MTGNGVDLNHLALCIFNILSDTGPKHCSADQCGDTADHMNGAGACVIVEAKLRKPAAAPDPVSLYRVDEKGDNCRIDAVGGELCAFGHSTRNDCCGGGAEHKVENKVGSVGKSVGRAFDKGLEVCEKIHIGYTDQSEKGILTHHKGITEK